MKTARGSIVRSVEQPDPSTRFYLFHGPDNAQSRALAARLLKALEATKFVLAAGAVRSDPALLADEAGAMSLFGGRRAVWIEPAGDEIVGGVEAVLESAASESPVIAIAGTLRKSSALLKLAEGHRQALAHASYVPEGRDAERMVVELGRTEGLKISAPVAARLAAACSNDQAVVAQELAKLALYLDASTEAPKELDHDALDAVGAAIAEGDFLHLADHALAGELNVVAEGLAQLSPGGTEAIPVIRSLQRRLLMLTPIRARIDRGERFDSVMASLGKSLFWKDKPLVEALLRKWDSAGLAKLAERAGRLEQELMLSEAPPAEALGEELVAVARQAAKR